MSPALASRLFASSATWEAQFSSKAMLLKHPSEESNLRPAALSPPCCQVAGCALDQPSWAPRATRGISHDLVLQEGDSGLLSFPPKAFSPAAPGVTWSLTPDPQSQQLKVSRTQLLTNPPHPTPELDEDNSCVSSSPARGQGAFHLQSPSSEFRQNAGFCSQFTCSGCLIYY